MYISIVRSGMNVLPINAPGGGVPDLISNI